MRILAELDFKPLIAVASLRQSNASPRHGRTMALPCQRLRLVQAIPPVPRTGLTFNG